MSLCINPQCNTQNLDNPLFCQACGSELLLEGRYRVIRRLSGGGFGTTYEVGDQNTSRVLKVLHNNSSKAVELFQREAQFLSSNNHPGIPKAESNSYFIYHPKNSQQPLHCLVMEKIEGENLREYIKQRGQPIKGNVALKWLHELVTILDRVHSQDIIHRDIKPNNIMLKPDGRLALIDFGAVREGTGTEGVTETATAGAGTEAATHAAGGTSIHSKAYTAPEQIEGHAIKQSDFFSLGRTFVFLLTAKEPNDSSMYDAYYNRINWRDHAFGVSPQLADLIDQMMAWTPRERPANTQVILQQLVQIDNDLTFQKREPVPPTPRPHPDDEISKYRYAGFVRRFSAAIIDGVISFIIFWLVGFSITSMTSSYEIGIPCTVIVNFSYYILFDVFAKGTPGKLCLGLRVVNPKKQEISLSNSSVRMIGRLLVIATLGIGFFSLLFNRKKQALHDILSNTIVIKYEA